MASNGTPVEEALDDDAALQLWGLNEEVSTPANDKQCWIHRDNVSLDAG